MDIRQNKKFDSTFHSKNVCANILKVNNVNTICANKNELSYYHNDTMRKKSDFYVKYRNRVYNIRKFLNYHPGGKNALTRLKDQNLDDELAKHSHSKSAYYLLEEFAVQFQERYNECEVSDINININKRDKQSTISCVFYKKSPENKISSFKLFSFIKKIL